MFLLRTPLALNQEQILRWSQQGREPHTPPHSGGGRTLQHELYAFPECRLRHDWKHHRRL